MKGIKLRPHHIDMLVAKEKVNKKVSDMVIKETARIYGDMGFAKRERMFIETFNKDIPIIVIFGNDYICQDLKCPFELLCKNKEYTKVARMIADKLPFGSRKNLVLKMTPEISDKWAMRRYGLKVRKKPYFLNELKVINEDQRIDNL